MLMKMDTCMFLFKTFNYQVPDDGIILFEFEKFVSQVSESSFCMCKSDAMASVFDDGGVVMEKNVDGSDVDGGTEFWETFFK